MAACHVSALLENQYMTIKLKIEPLTQDTFAPFGRVIAAEYGEKIIINEGTTTRHHALAAPDVCDDGGKAIISLFRADRRPVPIQIKMMERHPLGSQAFLPAQRHDWIVVVASGNKPTAETCRAFIATGEQGVQYNKGIWHHPLLILQNTQDFWVIDRAGSGDNLDEVYFDGEFASVDINGANE